MQRDNPLMTGNHYHVYNRGIDKRTIFNTENDYKRFMVLLHISNSRKAIKLDNLISHAGMNYQQLLEVPIEEKLVSISAWCVMTNHFHLAVRQEVDDGISIFMKKLGTAYSMFFNKKYQRQGALFGGRFKSKLVDSDAHMMWLMRYIHANPLDIEFDMDNAPAGLGLSQDQKMFLRGYPYSSLADYLGEERPEKAILNPSSYSGAEDLLQEFRLV